MAEQSKQLREIRAELEVCGLKPGTKTYQVEERSRKVEVCRQMNGNATCYNCGYFDSCELIKSHLRDLYKL